MQILGIIIIIIILMLLFVYFKWSKKEVEAYGGKEQRVTVVVSGTYFPNVIRAKAQKPLIIIFDRREDTTCSKKVLIPDFNIAEELPDFGKKEIKFTPQKNGEFLFTCEMGMYQGKIIVE